MIYGISFSVEGTPISKQSFIYDGNGHGHTDIMVKAWQQLVSIRCAEAMRLANYEMITGPVEMEITFVLPDKRRKDLDNLAKNCLDACNGILYKDDSQVHKLTLSKIYGEPGVHITARPPPQSKCVNMAVSNLHIRQLRCIIVQVYTQFYSF